MVGNTSASMNFPNKSSFFKQNSIGTADCATITDSFLAEKSTVLHQTPTAFKKLAQVDSCQPISAKDRLEFFWFNPSYLGESDQSCL
jgi:hypothetical protein